MNAATTSSQKSRVCIFGCTGFSGAHFQKYIADHHLTTEYDFFGFGVGAEGTAAFPIREIDARDTSQLRAALLDIQPQYIINLIGIFGNQTLPELLAINAHVSWDICQIVATEKIPVRKILLIGSAAEYGIPTRLPISENDSLAPVSPYGISKVVQSAFADFFIRVHHLPVVVARTFNIIGPGISRSLAIGTFLHQILGAHDGDTIAVGNLRSKRDYLWIDDVIDAYWRLALDPNLVGALNVCSGSSLSMGEILGAMIQASGKKLSLTEDSSRLRVHDVPDIYGDNSTLVTSLSWRPKYPILETIPALFPTTRAA